MLGKAFSKAKELTSKGLSKSKEYAKDKVHEQKRKIAVDVINSTDNKVKTKQEHLHLDRARQIVATKFADGGGVENYTNQQLYDFVQKYGLYVLSVNGEIITEKNKGQKASKDILELLKYSGSILGWANKKPLKTYKVGLPSNPDNPWTQFTIGDYSNFDKNDFLQSLKKSYDQKSIDYTQYSKYKNIVENNDIKFKSISEYIEKYANGGGVGNVWIALSKTKDGLLLSEIFESQMTNKQLFDYYKKKGYVIIDSNIFKVTNKSVLDAFKDAVSKYIQEKYNESVDWQNTLLSYQIVGDRVVAQSCWVQTKNGNEYEVTPNDLVNKKFAKGGGVGKLTEQDFKNKKIIESNGIKIELEKRTNPNYYIANYIDTNENEKISSYGSPYIEDVIYDIKTTKFAKGGGVGAWAKEIEIVALSQSGTRGYEIYDTMTNRRAINTDGSYEFDDGEISEIIGEKNMDAFYDGQDKFKPKKKLNFDIYAEGGGIGTWTYEIGGL